MSPSCFVASVSLPLGVSRSSLNGYRCVRGLRTPLDSEKAREERSPRPVQSKREQMRKILLLLTALSSISVGLIAQSPRFTPASDVLANLRWRYIGPEGNRVS